jgi:hypothetical protein
MYYLLEKPLRKLGFNITLGMFGFEFTTLMTKIYKLIKEKYFTDNEKFKKGKLTPYTS